VILKGSQRAGGLQLARHLLNDRDNDHVTVQELRGFVSDDLPAAFNEAYAISRGTKCKQFLFSLSLNPPETERVPVDVFEHAIAEIEDKLGLSNQPRAIIFHEKEGRRHAHCVWSRIDVDRMTAINLPHYKLKLRDMSRQLYLENNWKMPRGLVSSQERNPLNFTMAEWQQAKRAQRDPRTIKETFQDCWAISDARKAFASALEERGYYLAKGDRRGFVAVDWHGEIYAVSKWIGIKTKDVRSKLGDPDDLRAVEDIKRELSAKFTQKLREFADEEIAKHDHFSEAIDQKRRMLVEKQRTERASLQETHAARRTQENVVRSRRFPKGLKAVWFKLTGKYKKIQELNETEARQCDERDQMECQSLIDRQLAERRTLQHEIRQMRHHHIIRMKVLDRNLRTYVNMTPAEQNADILRQETKPERRKRTRQTREP
jgi:hypothetical protein